MHRFRHRRLFVRRVGVSSVCTKCRGGGGAGVGAGDEAVHMGGPESGFLRGPQGSALYHRRCFRLDAWQGRQFPGSRTGPDRPVLPPFLAGRRALCVPSAPSIEGPVRRSIRGAPDPDAGPAILRRAPCRADPDIRGHLRVLLSPIARPRSASTCGMPPLRCWRRWPASSSSSCRVQARGFGADGGCAHSSSVYDSWGTDQTPPMLPSATVSSECGAREFPSSTSCCNPALSGAAHDASPFGCHSLRAFFVHRKMPSPSYAPSRLRATARGWLHRRFSGALLCRPLSGSARWGTPLATPSELVPS